MIKLYKIVSFALFAILLSPVALIAQTTHDVVVTNAANGGFTPAELNIVQGDIVRWTNTEGFHSVEGSAEIFPFNPEAFGNEAGSGWVYEHTFDLIGAYNYRCGIHTQTMSGSITVSAATSVDEIEGNEILSLYPNPVVNELKWSVTEGSNIQNAVLTLFNINGKQVATIRLASQTSLDVSEFETGAYFFQIQDGDALLQTGKLLFVNQ